MRILQNIPIGICCNLLHYKTLKSREYPIKRHYDLRNTCALRSFNILHTIPFCIYEENSS